MDVREFNMQGQYLSPSVRSVHTERYRLWQCQRSNGCSTHSLYSVSVATNANANANALCEWSYKYTVITHYLAAMLTLCENGPLH